MAWTFHSLNKKFHVHRTAWDSLNAELYGANPYFDSIFVDNLLKHFGSGKEILCVHRTEDDAIDAMLIVEPVHVGKWRLFNPAQAQIAPLLVTKAEAIKALMADFPGLMFGLECPCQDLMYAPLASLLSQIPHVSKEHVRTMGVQVSGDFKDYWNARSSSLRKAIGRRIRRLADAGHVMRLRRLDDAAAMRDVVARFGEIESKGWKGGSGTAVHVGNPQGAFYADVMEEFAVRRSACVYELYFDDTLVAMQLCLMSPSMLVLLKTTYDEQYSNFSPGRLLLYSLLGQEFDRGRVNVVEFYTNADSNQLGWATQQRAIDNFILFRNGAVKALYCLFRMVRQRIQV